MDFFIVKDKHYNILFNVLENKFAKIPININKISDEYIYKNIKWDHRAKDEIAKKSSKKVKVEYMSSRTCNLKCKYCFAGEGKYGDRKDKDKFMTKELYMKSIKKMLELYGNKIDSISFFGGEPLLNYKEIKKFVVSCVELFEEKGISKPSFSITTNGTLISEEMIRFFEKYNVALAISLDGPKKINDSERIYVDNEESVYDVVISNLKRIKKYNIEWSLQVVITKEHINSYTAEELIEWLDYIEGFNCEYISISPVSCKEEEYDIRSENELEKLDKITRKLSRHYLNKLIIGETKIRAVGFISPITYIVNNKVKSECSAGYSVFVDTDSNIYPCKMFCNNEKYILGNIDNNVKFKENVRMYIEKYKNRNKKCECCIARRICQMWCRGIQLINNNDELEICESRCVFQRAIVEECIKFLCRLDKNSKEYNLFTKNLYRRFGLK